MKKVIFFSIIVLVTVIQALEAQNPIPSYNFPVSGHANFQEKEFVSVHHDNCLGKRDVVVQTTCGSSGVMICTATVWVYSLDGQTIYGPYTMHGGDTLRVEIDDREWGVYVLTDDIVIVNVWIE